MPETYIPCKRERTLQVHDLQQRFAGSAANMLSLTGHSKTSQRCPSNAFLTDLPEDLLISILKLLPFKTKCQAQAVCRRFRDILCKPSRGSFVWHFIQLDDPLFGTADPTALASWLTQRVCGILSLRYTPGDSSKRPASELALDRDLQREYQIFTHVLPQLAPMLSGAADMHLYPIMADAEPLGGTEKSTLNLPPNAVQPHWVNLARSLTRLELNHEKGVGHVTTSALHQLKSLRDLSLNGVKDIGHSRPRAHVELALPELKALSLQGFANARIALDCPRLEQLSLQGLYPLEALQGIPQEIKFICLKYLKEGPLSLAKIFQEHRLEQVRILYLWLWPEAYEDPSTLEIVKQAFRSDRLKCFSTNCPLNKLTPLKGPQCALPFSLRDLEVHLPLNEELPVVLQQLTDLEKLRVFNTGKGRMHLDGPLDPFLDMASLTLLTFAGRKATRGRPARPLECTPDASKFLGLATKRIEEGRLEPPGRVLVLKYQEQDKNVHT